MELDNISSKTLKFEDRMSAIANRDFKVIENDFPSLSAEVTKLPENIKNEPHALTVSYSEKLANPKPDSNSSDLVVKPKLETIKVCDQSNENAVLSTEEPTPVPTKKKRKRAKKKPKSTQTSAKDPSNAGDDSNIQINLEDMEEYPSLSASLSAKTNPKPENSNMGKQKKVTCLKEVNVPGIIKVAPETTKTQSKILGKKSKTPVEINIFDVLIKPKKQAEIKAKKLSMTFNVKKGKFNHASKIAPHNVLDSTAPIRKRGKEREKPKKAKLSKLKKIILYEREIRKQQVKVETVDSETSPIEPKEEISETVPVKTQVLATVEEISEEKKTEDEVKSEVLEVETETSDNLLPEVPKISSPDDIFVIPVIESEQEVEEMSYCVKKVLHSRKYRDYCKQRISHEIDAKLESLLQDLVRFQDRQFQKDPVKAKIKKRMVFGLKEVTKNQKINKVKLVIIAPDVEKIASEGGLNDTITNLVKLCYDNKIPVVFGLPRRKLGYVCKKGVPLSCIGVISYEGKEELYKELMDLVAEARESYDLLVKKIETLITPEIKQDLLNSNIDDKRLQEIKKHILFIPNL